MSTSNAELGVNTEPRRPGEVSLSVYGDLSGFAWVSKDEARRFALQILKVSYDRSLNGRFSDKVEEVWNALEPLGFDSQVICADGSEPFASLDLADDHGLVLYLTAHVRPFCNCCDVDGTHNHAVCEHPCCPDGDDDP